MNFNKFFFWRKENKQKDIFTEAFIEMLKERGARQVENGTPYNLYLGLTINVMIDNKECGFLQGIEFKSCAGRSRGLLTYVLFDIETAQKVYDLFDKQMPLTLKAKNENGETSILFDGIVKFHTSEDVKFSIEDLIVEGNLGFDVISRMRPRREDPTNNVASREQCSSCKCCSSDEGLPVPTKISPMPPVKEPKD